MLTWVKIDGSALRHNYRVFVKIAGEERVALVLKSNAYGHGLKETYQALTAGSKDETLKKNSYLCTNYLFEARALRGLGFAGRILVVGPLPYETLHDHFAEARELNAEVIIGNRENLESWLSLSEKPQVHIKFDTGMSRQGFYAEEAFSIADLLKSHKKNVIGLCTHFANVEDVLEHDYAAKQLSLFDSAVQAFHKNGLTPLKHAASSASCLLLKQSRFDLCRIGISLYGMWPSKATRLSYLQTFKDLVELLPVLSWYTTITTLKTVKSGQFIGYGCSIRAVQDMKVAVLPVGYYEGFPRLASDAHSYVLIRGVRAPIVGRVCMNMMMVDVTHLSTVTIGDQVTLIGGDQGETISANDLAGWAQTINYELLSRIHPDIPRIIQ